MLIMPVVCNKKAKKRQDILKDARIQTTSNITRVREDD